MEKVIIQEFKARIGDIEITNRNQFFIICKLIDKLSEKYKVDPDNNFVQDLKEVLVAVHC